MELPNYSRQLMQQLRALRKEGQFCDCTILVGDSPHRAHKLVLAASSQLFRSVLEGSDSISIDMAMVSTEEFSCLLDMVYTGKLPPGKHNFTRIIAAADSLQMFDVAVGCKNILTSLMKQSSTTSNTSITVQTQTKKPQSQGAELLASAANVAASPTKSDGKTTGDHVEREMERLEEGGGSEGGVNRDPQREGTEENEEDDKGPRKRARLQLSECTDDSGGAKTQLSESPAERNSSTDPGEGSLEPSVFAEEGDGSSVLLEHSSELMELLADIPSVMELLMQAASTGLAEQENKVVSECCRGAEPGLALQRLMDRVRKGTLSEGDLLKLLHTVQETSPSPSPRLLHLLEEIETDEGATMDAADAEKPEEDQHGCSGEATDKTNEEEEEGNEEEVGEEDGEEAVESEERKPRGAKAKQSSSSQPYSCRWCSKAFAFRCRLVAHDKSCSLNQEVKQQCPQCPEVLPTLRALHRHRAQVHLEPSRIKRKVACDLCGRTFAHPSGMLYHKRTEHFEEKPFACEECGAKFAANSSLKNHMRLHTGEKPYHCKHCAMSFSVAAALAYHTKKKHSEGKMYSCQYCEVVFAQSIELTRHVRTHTGDKPYVCRECGKGFSQANGLSVHLQTFHNITEPHDCHKCRLSFTSLEDHRKHIQGCHPREFHQCPVCQKTFTSAALLDKHKASHTGRKPFSCKLCTKSYQQLSGLWYHNRTTHPEVFAGQGHKQLKTLVQCIVCLRFFPSTGNSLAKHQMAEHPGIIDMEGQMIGNAELTPDSRMVRCLYCPTLFASDKEMQEHLLSCSEHFNQQGTAFGCSICSLVCASQLQLQEHLLSCHIDELEAGEEEGGGEASTSHTAEHQDNRAEQVISLDQSLLGGSQQQVYVALGDGQEGHSSSEVVAVNMEDILNGTVTFICSDAQ